MSTIHGFTLECSEKIDEINTVAKLYRHEKSGAQLLSMENEDENKVFGITFRTPPADSTGIAHILEHSVLGGSRKYPLKEPFVQLIKGSLKTFLNAMTYPDRTVYPVASTNTQDFYNLVDVYLDAVFHPLITRHHLDQEGWHYELTSMNEPLKYKGVVYNEMKGAYSSPDTLLYRTSSQSLFPDTTYSMDSGGDPAVIPQLTYKQFTEFHRTYYHPSNSLIFFYGDDDPTERLRLLDEVLRDFDRLEVDATVPLQTAFDSPQRVTRPYGVDADGEDDPKLMVQVNWMLPEGNDPALVMGLSILSYAMVSTQASPLRKRLIDSGLGEDVTGGGLSTGLRQMTFGVGLKGVEIGQEDAVEALVLETLNELAAEGLDEEMVEAAYNTFEFSLRENNTGSIPRGLSTMMRALNTWLYSGDPFAMVAFEGPLAEVRRALDSDPTYLQEMIRSYLLENPHRVTIVLTPDADYNRKWEEAEQARLRAIQAEMDPAALQAVIDNTQELRERQEQVDSPEALALLPTLELEDLERQVKSIPNEERESHGSKILLHDLFTNGIVYLDLSFDLHSLPADLLPYAKLFQQSLTEMGTEQEDFVKLSQRIGRTTGGIYPSSLISAKLDDPEGVARLLLRGKATMAQAPAMLEIMQDILLTVKLDNPERLRQIVLKNKARHESSLAPAGHSIVDGRLRAGFSTASWASDQMGGLAQLFFLRALLKEMDEDWSGVLAKLEAVREQVINRNTLIANVTLDDDNWTLFEPNLDRLIGALPAASSQKTEWMPPRATGDEGLSFPAQVNYVGKGANLYSLGYEYDGSIQVIANHLRTSYLWDKIRVQGGAYGAFNRFNRQSGIWTFLSYRDPNLADTLKVYDSTASYLQNLSLSDDDLSKSIIGAIGAMDPHQLPDAKGYTAFVRYLLGVSDEERQIRREQVLSTTAADFRAFADVLATVAEEGRVVVLGSQDALQRANDEAGAALDIRRVL